ncbi:S8 family peptidase [Pedobacter nototheniae]|uniref:S8 family peptidase n=1 Tax=Pedobacter nototheniae TaxID=2488994 RepID=UPI0010390C42|nr:S8 family peptidase [Pedobacter nototheniae]
MKFTNWCLTISLLCSASVAVAQVAPNKLDKKLQKYINIDHNNFINPSDSVVLVEFKTALTAEEISKINPKRQFSANQFIVSSKNLSLISQAFINKTQSNSLWKASDNLIQRWEQGNKKGQEQLIRLVFNDSFSGVPEYLKSYKLQSVNNTYKLIIISLPLSDLQNVLNHSEILFADVVQTAKEEIVISDLDLSSVDVFAAHNKYPELNGENITLSLKEGIFDVNDLDLLGKVIPGNNSSADNGHAVIMATLALGSGNSFLKGLGVAPSAKLITSDYSNLLPDDIKKLSAVNVSVQNHSYGTGIDNTYGIEAQAYDQQVYEADTIVHVFSAGNVGTSKAPSGVYQNIENAANLTGNFKQAKNVFVIGGIGRENVSEALSSKGPAYDGRVKPDVVSSGQDGTSGAAALTSGVVALLQQKYHSLTGKAASAALIKSVLVNSADDLGRPHVDYFYGFGKINALKALNTLAENRFTKGEVTQAQDFTFPIEVKEAVKELKVTLVWNDLPAAINSVQSIVNHLDLSVEDLNGKAVLPWVLSIYPMADSLVKVATRRIDQVNNVQQVTLDALQPGKYIVHVKGRKVTQDKQAFYLAYELNLPNQFRFTFPEKNDYLFATESNYIRWENTFDNKTGKLSVSYDNGSSWLVVAESLNLSTKFYNWQPPNRFTRALFKMEVEGQEFKGNSFIISTPPALKVGFNCTNNILFHWKPQPLAKSYTLYTIIDNKLTPIENTVDTMIIVKKVAGASPYFALSENGTDFTGLKSYTINYQNQGIACYLASLNGDIVANAVQLSLNIGTTYNLKSFIWEKQIDANTFVPIKEESIKENVLSYATVDASPRTGIQRYRVTFVTQDGTKIQSEIISINYLKEDDLIVYPNPVSTELSILNGAFDNYSLALFDMLGRKVFEETSNDSNRFNLSRLTSGIYVGVISKNKQQLKKFKIIKN